MTVNDVAKLLGKSPLTIRVGLQQGIFPFGVALKTREDRKNYTYIIYPELVKRYVGELEDEKN